MHLLDRENKELRYDNTQDDIKKIYKSFASHFYEGRLKTIS